MKSKFDDLMHRYITGEVSDQEKAKIEAWLDIMKTKHAADVVLTDDEEENLFQKITSTKNNITEIQSFEASHQKKKIRIMWTYRVAASVILILLAGAAWFATTDNNKTIDKLTLTDGTLVWTPEGNAVFFTTDERENRLASFTGEGLFEVAKDSAHPFIISYHNITIQVTGTSFNFKKLTPAKVELTVLTGQVKVSSSSNSSGITLSRNERVVFDPVTGTIDNVPQTTSEVPELAVSTEYNMKFNNVAMDQVIGKIEKKFDVNVRLANQSIAKCYITGDFTDRSLEKTLQLITEILHVQFLIDKKTVTLSGNGCS